MSNLRDLRKKLEYHNKQYFELRAKAQKANEFKFGSKFAIFAGTSLIVAGFFVQHYNTIVGIIILAGGLIALFSSDDPREINKRAHLHYEIIRQTEQEISKILSSATAPSDRTRKNDPTE